MSSTTLTPVHDGGARERFLPSREIIRLIADHLLTLALVCRSFYWALKPHHLRHVIVKASITDQEMWDYLFDGPSCRGRAVYVRSLRLHSGPQMDVRLPGIPYRRLEFGAFYPGHLTKLRLYSIHWSSHDETAPGWVPEGPFNDHPKRIAYSMYCNLVWEGIRAFCTEVQDVRTSGWFRCGY